MNGEEVSTDTSYVFSMDEPGNYKVELKAKNADGEVTAQLPSMYTENTNTEPSSSMKEQAFRVTKEVF